MWAIFRYSVKLIKATLSLFIPFLNIKAKSKTYFPSGKSKVRPGAAISNAQAFINKYYNKISNYY